MITKEDLKQIEILSYLTEPMLDKLVQITDDLKFYKDEIIFQEKESAERFYMVRFGKILLEQRISDEVTAYVGSIKPGFSFGWSAMLENGQHTTDAVCIEPSEVYSIKREKIIELFVQDRVMGFRMHQQLLVIIKNQLDNRTEQFRQAIMHHPAMQNLFRNNTSDLKI